MTSLITCSKDELKDWSEGNIYFNINGDRYDKEEGGSIRREFLKLQNHYLDLSFDGMVKLNTILDYINLTKSHPDRNLPLTRKEYKAHLTWVDDKVIEKFKDALYLIGY